MMSANEASFHPESGSFIHGLYMEGARWEYDNELDEVAESTMEVGGVETRGFLAESKLKELMSPMPVMYLRAVVVQPEWVPESVGYMRNREGTSVVECLSLYIHFIPSLFFLHLPLFLSPQI